MKTAEVELRWDEAMMGTLAYPTVLFEELRQRIKNRDDLLASIEALQSEQTTNERRIALLRELTELEGVP